MKKLLTLFTLLLTVCSGAWGDEVTATLINQSTGDVNSTDFKTTLASKSETYTCGDYGTFTKYIQMGGAVSTPIGAYQQDRVIRYDVLTNSVTVDVYAYNKATSTDYKLYISMVEEGDAEAKDIDIKEFTVTKKSGDKFTWTFTPTTNASIYIHVGNNSNVYICQAEVTDNGATTLKQGGEIGYTANLTLCRIANNKALTSMDGIEYNATSNSIKVLTSGNPVKLKATTEYIKFTLNETEKVSINASGTYSVTTENTYQSESAVSGNQNIILDAGTYYICPNGSNVIFASLSFLAPPSLYTVTYNLNGGTGTTPTESDKAEGAKFTLHDGVTDITAPTGKEFSKWKDQDANEYDGGTEFTMPGKDVKLTAQWTDLKCATPTITVDNTFNFANKGYKVTITNNEDGSTLKVSTDGETYTTQTSPYVTYATATTPYYAKSEKASYDDSEVAYKNVENTFDTEKKYIAWVYQSETYTDNSVTYNLADDGIYLALKDLYNVVPMAISNGTSITVDHDIKNADLIINAEAMSGSSNLAVGMKNFLGVKPMMNFKIWAYGSSKNGSERWGWGKPANVDESGIITPASTTYKLLNGVTLDGGNIILFSGTTGRVQTVNWTSEPTNNVNMATNTDVAMHAIIDNNHLDKQFFGFGVSCNYRTQYNENTKTIVKNAAAMLIAGTERLDAEMATVSGTITDAGWNTFSSSYALDLSTITGGKAYVATSTEGSNVTMAPVEDKIVAAGTGLMIKGTKDDTFTINTTSEAADYKGDNLLVGLPNGGTVAVAGEGFNYVFGWTNPAEPGFYLIDGDTPTLGANKAYLHTTTALSGKLNIIIDDSTSQEEETDGIKAVSTKVENGVRYNLAGQKVGADYKGIVIVNGKKMLNK